MNKKGNPDIVKHGFGANPQNINRKGRPKKSWRTVNDMLQQNGVEKLTKQDLIDGYALIFNSTEDDLEILLEDDETPFALKAMIESMRDKKFRDQALRDYRDYAFGKTAQQHEHKFVEQPLFPSMSHKKELSQAQEPVTIDITHEPVKISRETAPQDEEKEINIKTQ